MAEHGETQAESFEWADFRLALKAAMPLTVSIFGYGLVFGVLARQSGLTPWEIPFMSTAVIAGSSQFVANGHVFRNVGRQVGGGVRRSDRARHSAPEHAPPPHGGLPGTLPARRQDVETRGPRPPDE